MATRSCKLRLPDRREQRFSLQWMWMLLFVCFVPGAIPGLIQVAMHALVRGNPGVAEINRGWASALHGVPLWIGCLESVLTLSALSLALGTVRSMLRQTRRAVIQEERRRLARELHDTVIRGCTGVSVLLEAAATTRDRSETMKGALLESAREQARRTVEATRTAVWELRRDCAERDLVLALKEMGEEVSRESGSTVEVRHNVAFLPMPARSTEEISMTAREAVCNAVRHSGSERIVVDLQSDTRSLRVAVQDYGCGITVKAKPKDLRHYGIQGMQERMERLGGGLEIHGMPGRGTTVHLMLRRDSMRKFPVRV